MRSLYKLTLLLLIVPSIVFATTDDKKKHEKSKTIKKEYAVNANAEVILSNKYGNISITTWNENRVAIEVKITVKGNDLDDVLDRLEDITIDFNADASFVSAKTNIVTKNSIWNWLGSGDNINFKIEYIVKMPATNSVNLTNKYGAIYLDKLLGAAKISCDYGKVTIGQLMNTDNIIDLDYCATSTIGYAKKAEITIDYSKLSVDKSQFLKLNADYSTFSGGEINDINFNTDYGAISIENVKNTKGISDYTAIKLGKVSKNLSLDADYGSISIEELVKGFENITIEASYTGVKVGTAKNNNFKFNVDLQYGNFKYDKDLVDIYKSEVKSSRKNYEGVFGKGAMKSAITINARYGSVTLN